MGFLLGISWAPCFGHNTTSHDDWPRDHAWPAIASFDTHPRILVRFCSLLRGCANSGREIAGLGPCPRRNVSGAHHGISEEVKDAKASARPRPRNSPAQGVSKPGLWGGSTGFPSLWDLGKLGERARRPFLFLFLRGGLQPPCPGGPTTGTATPTPAPGSGDRTLIPHVLPSQAGAVGSVPRNVGARLTEGHFALRRLFSRGGRPRPPPVSDPWQRGRLVQEISWCRASAGGRKIVPSVTGIRGKKGRRRESYIPSSRPRVPPPDRCHHEHNKAARSPPILQPPPH